jgi:hypothetical protein
VCHVDVTPCARCQKGSASILIAHTITASRCWHPSSDRDHDNGTQRPHTHSSAPIQRRYRLQPQATVRHQHARSHTLTQGRCGRAGTTDTTPTTHSASPHAQYVTLRRTHPISHPAASHSRVTLRVIPHQRTHQRHIADTARSKHRCRLPPRIRRVARRLAHV